MIRFLPTVSAVAATLAALTLPSGAATMKVAPSLPQPGDVLTVTIYPAAGETLEGVGMAAFDTAAVKFYQRPDGTIRAYLGYPFDRTGGGNVTLKAGLQLQKNDKNTEQIVSSTFRTRSRHYPTQRISMGGRMASTMSKKAALRKEKLHVQSKMKNSHPEPLWDGSWIVPCKGSSSSAYGRKRYVNGKWWGQHNGADIKASTGTRVGATNGGRVVLSEYLKDLRGNCVVIDHGCNIFSIYMHLSKRLVREGDSVSKNQKIGEVGATGFVTGPHLHWEMRIGWEPVDPFKFIKSGPRF